MENLEQRALAAKRFLIDKAKNHAFVQSIKQRSLRPYKESFENALEPGNLLMMGRVGSTKATRLALDPKTIARGVAETENDIAQWKAMQHFDSAQKTAERIKQYMANKAKEEFNRVHSSGTSPVKMLAQYIFRNQ